MATNTPVASGSGLWGWPADRWLSLAAVIIAFCALLLAVYTAYLSRDYLRRSQEPEMLISFYFNDTGSGYRFGNIGLGPARVEWFQILLDGSPQPDFGTMITRLGIPPGQNYNFSVPAPVFLPGGMNQIFWVKPGEADKKLREQYTRVVLKACYCSIFYQCWISSIRGPSPEKVSTCEPFPKVRYGGRFLPEDSSQK